MALKAVVTAEELAELDESTQELYKENQAGDAHILDVSGIDSHPTVKGLKSTLSRFKAVAPDAAALKKIKERADALEETWGELDPEETKAALERLAELDAGEGGDDLEAKLKAAREAVERKFTKQLEKKDEDLAEALESVTDRDGFIETMILDRELDAGLSHAKTIEELRPGAKALIRAKYAPKVERVTDESTGKTVYRGVIADELGESSVADFFEKWSKTEEAQPYLPASGNAGTGSRTGDGGRGGSKNPWAKESWNLTEQGRIFQKNPALARQMAAAHGHKIQE